MKFVPLQWLKIIPLISWKPSVLLMLREVFRLQLFRHGCYEASERAEIRASTLQWLKMCGRAGWWGGGRSDHSAVCAVLILSQVDGLHSEEIYFSDSEGGDCYVLDNKTQYMSYCQNPNHNPKTTPKQNNTIQRKLGLTRKWLCNFRTKQFMNKTIYGQSKVMCFDPKVINLVWAFFMALIN